MKSEFSNRNTVDVFATTQAITSHHFDVLSWSPEPVEAKAPATEVHVLCTVFKAPGMAFIVRLKSRAICQELIEALQKHMADVWPEEKTNG